MTLLTSSELADLADKVLRRSGQPFRRADWPIEPQDGPIRDISITLQRLFLDKAEPQLAVELASEEAS